MCSADTASSAELVGVKICRQPTYGSGRRGALMGTCVLWGHAKGNTCFSWGLRVACPHNIYVPIRAHLGTATDTVRGRLVAPTGPDASEFRRMVFGRWADWQSTASLRYGGSAKMRPRLRYVA